ncbi:MAG: YybS family protein [Desulfofustis sp.]|nr:YybS family protein [Desulfofustis sp.]NNK58531.1 DUF2232 domain-containing protein [Desulfofustis sp.]
MSTDTEGRASTSASLVYIILFSLALLLPSIHVGLFGWIYFMIPLLVLIYQYRWRNGLKFVSAGLILALAVSLFISSVEIVIFSAALIPVGYSLAQSAFRSDSPALSGFKGLIFLVSCWLILLTVQTALIGVNPIGEFLGSLDSDIERTLDHYRQNDSVAPETLVILEESFFQMKSILPKILVSMMINLALLVIWSTMLLGNRLVPRFTGYHPWPDHQTWRLPDKLIWLLIGAAIITIVPAAPLRIVGGNLLICIGLIYIFQGFAVMSFFLHKWNVPQVVRFLLYAMMLFQSFGTVLLLILGIGEVWFDFRGSKKDPQDYQNNSDQ